MHETVTETTHIGVVGGGIAGLAAALACRQQMPDARITVLEGSARIGGKLSVSEVAGVPVDEGAEAVLNRRPEAVELARQAGLGDDLTHPATLGSSVWTRGALRPLPPTLMGIPTDLAALARSGIVSPAGLVRAPLDRVLPGTPIGEDVAVRTWVRHRLGSEIVDRLVEPLLGGVYAGHARDLSLRAGVPQIAALAQRNRSLLAAARASAGQARANAPGPVFAGIRGGVGRLPPAVAAAAGAEIRTGAVVRQVVRRPDGWRLVFGSAAHPRTLDVDAAVIAVPAAPASRLLREAAPHAATELAAIGYASVAVVTFAFPRDAVGDAFTGSGFLVPPVDGRAIKAATYSSHKWGWVADADRDLVLVRTSLGRYGEEHDLQVADNELTAVALADLRAATGISATPVDTRVNRWGGALPQYLVGHGARVAAIRAAVAAQPGLAVCGAAYDGIGIAACVASARHAATQVVRQLGQRGRITT